MDLSHLLWPEYEACRLVLRDGAWDARLSTCSQLLVGREGFVLTLRIPAHAIFHNPLQIVSLLETSHVQLLVEIGREATLEIVHITEGRGREQISYVLEEGASLKVAERLGGHIERTIYAELGKGASLSSFSSIKPSCCGFLQGIRHGLQQVTEDASPVIIKRSSLLSKKDLLEEGCTQRACMIKRKIDIVLKEEGAKVTLRGLDRLEGRQEVGTQLCVTHLAPECYSQQKFVHVLEQQSKVRFDGKVKIQSTAQRSSARQMIRNLLLSDTASAKTTPALEVHADDVVASHGATYSQVDPEQLFYLQARGLHRSRARALILQGFCQEMIDGIEPTLYRRRFI